MKNIHIIFICIGIGLFLCGCKSHKDLTRLKTSTDQMEAIHAALNSNAVSSSTMTEKAKGEAAVPEKSISATGNTAKGPVIFDGPVFSGTMTTDPATGITKLDVKTKPFTVPFDIDKTTTTTSAATVNANIDRTIETHSAIAMKELHKVVDPPVNWNYGWIIAGLISCGLVLFFLWYFFGFKRRKREQDV